MRTAMLLLLGVGNNWTRRPATGSAGGLSHFLNTCNPCRAIALRASGVSCALWFFEPTRRTSLWAMRVLPYEVLSWEEPSRRRVRVRRRGLRAIHSLVSVSNTSGDSYRMMLSPSDIGPISPR